MILAWGFIIHLSISVTSNNMQYFHFDLEEGREEETHSPWVTEWKNILYTVTLYISIPIASLLAEVLVGRYRLISISLKVLWLISLFSCLLTLCEYSLQLPGDKIQHIHFFLIVMPQYALLGAFLACAVPLGLDQITEGSNTNICAFIVWFTWTFPSGFGLSGIVVPVIYGCFHTESAELNLITSLLPVFLLSLGLLLDLSFQHTLVQVPPSTNPVRLIFKVLKYAAKHRRAAQRSAFTYCENEEPGRLDYGKSKYGGPFTTEQVEDVKTFWRVLTVIAVIVAFYCPLQPLFESHVDLEKHFSPIEVDSECVEGVLHGAISPFSLMAYSVPVYEFFVYPCLKGTPGILKSVGIEAALVNIASIYGVMVETVRETLDRNGTQCMFSDETRNREIETNSLLIIIPYHFIVGFSIYGLYKSSIEFVCAQAPYNMTGLLIGLLYMLMSLV